MARTKRCALIGAVAASLLLGGLSLAGEIGAPLTNDELTALLDDGRELTLGGPEMGYSGQLKLNADKTGAGSARTDAGQTIEIDGVWRIAGDGTFCRTWHGLDGGAEVCETWVRTSDTSADVFWGDQKIGVNSW